MDPTIPRTSRLGRRDSLSAIPFLIPFFVVFIVFRVFPIAWGFILSLFDRDLLGMRNTFIGLGNYSALLQDNVFWASLWNTFRYVVMSTPTIIPMSLILALLLVRPMRWGGVFRVIFFLPRVLSVAVVSVVWVWILQPRYGLLNNVLASFGIPAIGWLTNPAWAMFSIVIVDIWWVVGFQMIIFIAGLSQIDAQLYEAAWVDGANPWQSFWHITFPGIRPSLLFVLVMHVIGAFQIFGKVFIMTGGGPQGSTRVLVQYIYESGFEHYRMGYASALAYVLMFFILLFTLLQFRVLRER